MCNHVRVADTVCPILVRRTSTKNSDFVGACALVQCPPAAARWIPRPYRRKATSTLGAVLWMVQQQRFAEDALSCVVTRELLLESITYPRPDIIGGTDS